MRGVGDGGHGAGVQARHGDLGHPKEEVHDGAHDHKDQQDDYDRRNRREHALDHAAHAVAREVCDVVLVPHKDERQHHDRKHRHQAVQHHPQRPCGDPALRRRVCDVKREHQHAALPDDQRKRHHHL